MIELKRITVKPSSTILETMEIIDKGAVQIAFVVDEDFRLLGTVTDGDIRRGLLRGIALHDSVDKVMNNNPFYVMNTESPSKVLSLSKRKKLNQIPIVDKNKRLIDVKFVDRLVGKSILTNPVVLMVGGLGTRLKPLTDTTPKPLLKVGNKPILETILESFVEHGFQTFFFTVNYKSEMIIDYFGDGSRWGVEIEYIHESKRLGTAGALSLFRDKLTEPFIVMNGDILTKVNFRQLLNFHKRQNAVGTMCVRNYEYQVPYGVIKTKGQNLTAIEEKPVHQYFVNAGIYALNPSATQYIPDNTFFDMPQLFEELIRKNEKTVAFPVREYWLDIGKMNDFERANIDYINEFSN
jgi:dTDP-glucose pyrophosphorylase